MIAEKVTEHTFANVTGESRGNIGAISLPNYAIVIDTGMYPAFTEKFRTHIETITKTPVRKVILTHYHGDHIFGNQIFKDCPIISSQILDIRMREVAPLQWTHEQLAEVAKKRPDSYAQLDINSLEIIFPTETFEKTFSVVDDKVEIHVKLVGGHCDDHSYVYFPSEQVIFAGDLIFANMFPWAGDPSVDPEKWIAVLKEFKEMKVETIIPGHGPVCDLREVQIYLDFFEPVAKIMKEMISEGRSQAEIIAYDGYPDFYISETPERYQDSLAMWYQFYKKSLG